MRLKKISLFSVLVVWMVGAAACSSTPDVPHAPDPGDSDFISAAPGGGGAYGATADSSTEGGRNEAPAAQETTPEREIEEADIVKLDGNLLYALNSYRGLYIIDMADPDAPEILGHQDMFGYPVEMYVRDGRAYVVLSNYFRMWLTADGDADPEVGSNVTVVDVLEPSAPFVLSRFHMPGYVTDTRIVGDVLYTVSNRYWWFWYYGGNDNEDTTTVMSLNIANPANIHLVDDYTFDRCEGWDNHIHVTTEAIYVASSCWDYDGYNTQVRYVDISNPAGQMALGAQFEFEGVVRDRWALSEHDGVLRVVAADTWWSTDTPRIHTCNVTSPTQIQPLATLELQLPRPESVTATRFDGDRAYVVTYERVDPLYTVDLSDPTNPIQSGELEMPGWLDHIVPRGNRLVALGHDEVNGETRLAVSLFDVTQLSQPTLLSRVHFGEGWGWLTDERDNFDKVFKVLDDPGLILVPFMQWIENSQTGWWRYKGGVQLIDFTNDALTLRGHAQHDGYIRRALVHNHRLVTLSDQRLQVMDIGDRDNPTPTADLALSRNVTQFAVMGNYAVQLVGDWYRGNTSVVVLPLSDPDLGEPVAELAIEAPYARLFSNDDHLFVLYRDVEDYSVKLQSVDLSDPTNPQLASLLTLPETFDTYGYYYGWWWWGWWWYPRYDSVTQVNGSTLVFHASRCWWYWYGCYDGGDPDQLLVVDLSTPDTPVLASQLSLTNRPYAGNFMADGDKVVFTHFQYVNFPGHNEHQWVRYYMNRLDVSDPYDPQLLTPVNVPGVVLDINLASGRIVTEDYQWLADSTMRRSVNISHLYGNLAILRGRVTLPEDAGRVVIDEEKALFAINRWWYDDVEEQYRHESSLQGIDLSNPMYPALTAEIPMNVPYLHVYRIQGDKAIMGTWWYLAGLMVYDIADLNNPLFTSHLRTQGWLSDMVIEGSTLYVATGPYGVHTIDLNAPSPVVVSN